jgi:hypothetical protein
VYYNVGENSSDTITTAFVKFKKRQPSSELKKLESWLKARTQADTLKLVVE